MKTSAEWWAEVKADPAKFNDWLQRQYRGEVTAAKRIMDVIDHFDKTGELTLEDRKILYMIGIQETAHSVWIRRLLEDRGLKVDPDTENAEKRYWSTQDLSFKDFSKTMAVAAHAEKMRLERIQVISEDEDADIKVRKTFDQILQDELMHEFAFRKMAGETAMANTKADHNEGRKLLGLEA